MSRPDSQPPSKGLGVPVQRLQGSGPSHKLPAEIASRGAATSTLGNEPSGGRSLSPSQFPFLFDLDGTLLDTVGLIVDSYQHTFAAHELAPRPDEEFRNLLGIPLADVFRRYEADEDRVQTMVQTYRRHNHEIHDDRVSAYEGIREAVAELEAQGHPLAIVTSKSRPISERGLEICGLRESFAVVVALEDVAQHKPHPEPVLKALESLGASPEQGAIFVGDAPFDMVSGRAAGVRTAAALWGPFSRAALEPCEPTFWLEHPDQIPALTIERIS